MKAQASVVTNMAFSDVRWQRFVEVFNAFRVVRCAPDDLVGLESALRTAEVAVLAAIPPIESLAASSLKWLHVNHAGFDKVARVEFLERGLIVTGAAGYSVETLAEHAFFFMLSLNYRAADLMDAQRRCSWDRQGREVLRSLYGKTIGVIGLGHIGCAIAKRADAFGMRVIGFRRSDACPTAVTKIWSSAHGETIKPLLEQSDFVVLALPLTDQSKHLIDAQALASMKPSACLINIARGAIVDELALINALEMRQIAGAGLDVFAVEPLPADSPLWRMNNVVITPHSSPAEPDREDRALDLIERNATRYQRHEFPLINQMSNGDVLST